MVKEPVCAKVYLSDRRRKQLNPIGEIDEKAIIPKLIKEHFQGKKIALVCLGIGAGRELEFLYPIDEIKEIYGLDISPAALRECRERIQALNFTEKKIRLFEDSIFDLKHWKDFIKRSPIKKPIVYTMLLNTLGVFSLNHRKKIVDVVRGVIRKEDMIIISGYKLPIIWKSIPDNVLEFWEDYYGTPKPQITGKKLLDTARYLYFDRPYIREDLLGHVFTLYNPKTNDVEVYKFRQKHDYPTNELSEKTLKGKTGELDLEKIFFTHRWKPGEIEGLLDDVNIKTETNDGNYMYIIYGKIE